MSEDETSPPLTLFAEDFPAKTSVTLARAQGSTASDRDSGINTHESFASWNPATSSWKTSQHSLLEDLTTFSERWPIAGTMQSGRVFARSTWVPRISATDYSLLPTPRAIYGERPGMLDPSHLTGAVHLWPTPRASDWKGAVSPTDWTLRRVESNEANLAEEIQERSRPNGGQLNPMWVEWLMGFPLGWTVLEHWVTQSSRKSRKPSGA